MPDLFTCPADILAAKGADGEPAPDGGGSVTNIVAVSPVIASPAVAGNTTTYTVSISPGGEGQLLSVVGGEVAWINQLNEDAISEVAAQASTFKYAAQSGLTGGNAYTFDFTPAIAGYTDGMYLVVLVNTANTADDITGNLGAGAVSILKNDGSEYLTGEFTTGYYILVYQDSSSSFRVVAEEIPKFRTSLADGTLTPTTVGGIAAGTDVATLKNQPTNTVIQNILFPLVLASITTGKSVSLGMSGTTGNVEVGTALSNSLNATFNPGTITNGDGVTTLDLVGAASTYEYSGAGTSNPTITGASLVISTVAVEGSNAWSVVVNHAGGSGSYTDSEGNTGAYLDASRVSGTVNDASISPAITGYFSRFYGATAATPVSSADVRSLPSGVDLDTGNTFTLNTGNSLTKFVICLPPGRTITSVIDTDALSADITSSYVSLGTISVDDPSTASHVYNIYEMNIGAAYSSSHAHVVTITG